LTLAIYGYIITESNHVFLLVNIALVESSMPLSASQQTALKADILLDPALSSQPLTSDGAFVINRGQYGS
jgi:hypothetical protein